MIDSKVERIALGHGPTELEVFIEPTCPHSGRAFEKLQPLVDEVGADKLTVLIRFVSQPWHTFSSIATRAILAARAAGGQDAAMKAMAGIYGNRSNFVLEEHSHGPNLDRTASDMIKEISGYAGIDLTEPYKLKPVDRAMRWHARYYRQNGIHSSPTFAIDGVVEPNMGSRQSLEEWVELLKPHMVA